MLVKDGLTVNSKQRSPSDVVTVTGLEEHLDAGWQLHVVCNKEPEMRGYQWHGSWYLVGVDPADGSWVVLVTARSHARERQSAREQGREERKSPEDYAFREVKTASGLISLLRELGFTIAGVPTKKGENLILTR